MRSARKASGRTKRSNEEGLPKSMPALLSPTWRVYFVTDEPALEALIKELQIEWRLAGNLRQLCAFRKVGDDRGGRSTCHGWHLFESVQFVVNTATNTIVPVVGTAAEKLAIIRSHQPDIEEKPFKNLLNGSKKTPLGVWKKMTSAPVMNINHGDSLLDRLSTATVRSLTSVPLYNG